MEVKKYLIKQNSVDYSNGDIVISDDKPSNSIEKYAYTIHSVQGEDYESNLYIDTRRLKSIEVLYTAISRAKTKKQIHFVV